jgi:O-6-methylguanine DNA methyltransferase
MKSERYRIAEKFRSEGAGEASKINGEKERDLKTIQSEAYRKAEEIRGLADARATAIYANSYDQSASSRNLYSFMKSMETLVHTFDTTTSVILSTDSELYKYLINLDENFMTIPDTITIATPLGDMIAGATSEGLCLLEFRDEKIKEENKIHASGNDHLLLLRSQLKEYFDGTRCEFKIPLVLDGTVFQQTVWKGLISIPYGATRSYQEQAESLNKPGSVRAVANANGMNRIAIIIPCHRVIGSNGKLTGYAGGLHRKKWLLDHERRFSGKAIDLSLF